MPETETPAPPAPKKEPGPRGQGTKYAAASRIAAKHESPEILVKLLSAEQPSAAIGNEAAEIATSEASLKARKLAFAERKQFVEEIGGLDPALLVGVRAILDAKLPRKSKRAAGAQGEE